MPDPDVINEACRLNAASNEISEQKLYEQYLDEYLPLFSNEPDAQTKLAEWAYDKLSDDSEELAKAMGAKTFGDWVEDQG